MTKKDYYAAKRAEIMAELRRRVWGSAEHWQEAHTAGRMNLDCPAEIRLWEYRSRYGDKGARMGPARMAEIGPLVGIPVWAPPTIRDGTDQFSKRDREYLEWWRHARAD